MREKEKKEERRMRRYSIKTTDGSRFDFETTAFLVESIPKDIRFLGIEVSNGKKYFNLENVVSIAETKVDE